MSAFSTILEDKHFECEVCHLCYKSEESLFRHYGTHHKGEQLFKCKVCSQRFASRQEATEHGRSHVDRSVTCGYCQKQFHRGHYRRHLNLHTGEKQYVCEICGVHYTQKDSLKFHKLMKHGERQFACKFPNCAKRFFSETSLNRHAFNHLDKNQVKCDKCQRGFTHERHLKSHSPRCPMNDEKQAKRAEEREKLKCKFCPRVCANQSRLKTHMTSHTGERAFACELCDKSFAQRSHLNFHRRVHHEGKRLACERCGSEFVDGRSLLKHRSKCGMSSVKQRCKKGNHRCGKTTERDEPNGGQPQENERIGYRLRGRAQSTSYKDDESDETNKSSEEECSDYEETTSEEATSKEMSEETSDESDEKSEDEQFELEESVDDDHPLELNDGGVQIENGQTGASKNEVKTEKVASCDLSELNELIGVNLRKVKKENADQKITDRTVSSVGLLDRGESSDQCDSLTITSSGLKLVFDIEYPPMN